MNSSHQQKTIALYSQKHLSNKNSMGSGSSNGHVRHNSNSHMNRRNELFQKNFSPTGYEPFDRERMEEELSKLLREINKKTKEYQALKNAHTQTEADNLKTIKLIETLITDCKQIENPIERNNSVNMTQNSKNQSLMQNLKDKLNAYQSELVQKDEKLSELKSKNQKILRLFEIENKLAEASEKYENLTKKYNDLMVKLNELDDEIQKANEAKDFYIFSNNKIKQDNEDTKNKIKILENENSEMANKEKSLEEKNTNMKTKLSELRNSIKEKDEEIEKLKQNIEEYNNIMNEKEKIDNSLLNQAKQINILRGQNEKKGRQIRELEKSKEDYDNELLSYQKNEKNPKPNQKLINIMNDKKKKEEELNKIKEDNKNLKKELEDKKNQIIPKPFVSEKQISFNLNVPLAIDRNN